MGDQHAQLQALLDREAIRDLVNRYAHLIWQNQPMASVDLFTEDGIMDLGADGGIIAGRAALRAAYGTTVAAMVLQPFVHNHIIELDGDRASGTVYLDLRCIRAGQSLMGSGHYRDQYRRQGDTWKFSQRKLTMHYLVSPGQDWDHGQALV
jgi:ketosteroid isomerase-like protein